jgi:hypothetical protein
LVLSENNTGKIVGVAIGYSLETIGKNRNRLFFLDHFLPGPEKAGFILAVEAKAEERFGVYGLVTLDGRLGLREGYLPSRTVLSYYSIPFCEETRQSKSAHSRSWITNDRPHRYASSFPGQVIQNNAARKNSK